MPEKSSSITTVVGKQGGMNRYYLECMEHHLECMDAHLGKDEELTQSLWIRSEGRAGTGDFIVGVCYRLPDQGDRVVGALYSSRISFYNSRFTFISPGPHEGLQPPQHLLDSEHSRAQAIQEVPGMN